MNSLYKERLLELYAERKNFGEIKDKTYKVRGKNPICTDEIVIELKTKDKKIVDAKFHGKTCFVSTISAEVLMENIKGMKIEDVMK